MCRLKKFNQCLKKKSNNSFKKKRKTLTVFRLILYGMMTLWAGNAQLQDGVCILSSNIKTGMF